MQLAQMVPELGQIKAAVSERAAKQAKYMDLPAMVYEFPNGFFEAGTGCRVTYIRMRAAINIGMYVRSVRKSGNVVWMRCLDSDVRAVAHGIAQVAEG